MNNVQIGKFLVGKNAPLTIICGPCVIESEEQILRSAEYLTHFFSKTKCNFIFKSSYKKANRSALDSFQGVGIDKGLKLLERIKKEFGVPVTSDIHEANEAAIAGEVLDLVQIPAFLCRQTDLLIAAAQTKKAINVKKGQFMAPWDMHNVVEKIYQQGNKQVILTDRGVTFGYNNLVSDMRAIPIMQQLGVPVCFDATHSVQLPGGLKTSSGGQREFIAPLAKAAIAAGANLLFLEAHHSPELAKSDKASQLSFEELSPLITVVEEIYQIVNKI